MPSSNEYLDDPYGLQATMRRRPRQTATDSLTTVPDRQPTTVDTGIPTGTGTFLPGEQDAPGTGYNQGPNDAVDPNYDVSTNTEKIPAYAQYAMPGWDQTKWADPFHQTPKYQVGRILSQFGPSASALQQALPQIQAAFPGATLVGTDKLNIPGVGLIDVGGNFNDDVTGNEQWWWGDTADTGAGAATAGAGVGTSGVSAGGGYSNAGGAGGGAFGDSIRAKILELMGQSPTDISTNPVYTGAMDAYRTEQQRAMERERNAIAERMAAEGTANSGGMTSRLLEAEQNAGENTATFAGQLGIRELERQRDEIMQALTLGAGLMTEQQRIALTERLGLINANLQQQSILNQNTQFNQSLGWQQAMWEYLQNQGWWQ